MNELKSNVFRVKDFHILKLVLDSVVTSNNTKITYEIINNYSNNEADIKVYCIDFDEVLLLDNEYFAVFQILLVDFVIDECLLEYMFYDKLYRASIINYFVDEMLIIERGL